MGKDSMDQRRPRWHTTFRMNSVPLIVLVVGIVCSLAVWQFIDASQKARDRAHFEEAVAQSQENINGMLRTYLTLGRGVAALFRSDHDVTYDDFHRYTEPLSLAKLYPGLYTIAFVSYVPNSQVPAFEAKHRADRQPNYKASDRHGPYPYRMLVTYVSPLEIEQKVPMGFDMTGDPDRFDALRRAWLTGQPATTKKITVGPVGQGGGSPGLLMFIPVYQGDPASRSEREKGIFGFAVLSLKGDMLLSSARGNDRNAPVQFDIYDGQESKENLLGSKTERETNYKPQWTQNSIAQVGDKNLTLVYRETSELTQSGEIPLARVTLIGGLMLSFLLFFLSLGITRTREAALEEIGVRKAAEDALATSERQLRTVLDALPVGVWLLDKDGNVELSNPAAERLWPQNHQTAPFADRLEGSWVTTGDPLETADLAPAKALKEGLTTINDLIDVIFENGQRKTLLNSAVPLRDSKEAITGAVVVNEDVSMRRHSEAALLESEERFRAMADSAPVLLWVSDVEGKATWFNKPWLDYVGRPLELELGEGWLESVHPGDLARVKEAYADSFKRRIAFELEFRFRRIDGAFRWFLNRGVPRVAPEGSFLGYIGSCLDIEDRKQAEEAMKSINATLERWVEDRTRDLRRTIDELESFSYTVAHDLRAPLRAMGGFAQILQEDHKEVLTPEGLSYLKRIRENSGKMAQLIDGLLDLARISRAELQRNEVDLTAIAGEVANMLKGRSPERRLEFDIKPDLKAVGDERLLGLVLQNLLENAWKFTAPKDRAVIEVGALPGSPASQGFYVRDNGVGFDMAHASKLFGTFERLHSPGEFPGSGIGLASVKRIVERHGGKVWAEASPGKGATFYFTIGRWPTPRQGKPQMI